LSGLTVHRRLGRGPVIRSGASSAYRAVEIGEGEPHLVRDELAGAPGEGVWTAARTVGRPLFCGVHITDLQLADVQSPARFEFLNARFADPRYAEILPVQRPQEALTAHAVDATVRTLSAVRGPATGLPLQLAVTTGDAIDNAQWNELQMFLALLDGGLVSPDSGGSRYEGVQSLDWPDDMFWKPDGGGDYYRREHGFPHHPGLLRRAMREFAATGLGVPWLSCFGNHEALNQGVGTQTQGLAAALTGDRKPTGLPDGFDHDAALELFTSFPEAFMAGPALTVAADPARRPISRRDFVEAHLRAGSRPSGHGFGERNRLDGTAYYAYDTQAVRFIALDTNCLAGGSAGCLDRDQARWLEARLAEVHSAYRGPDGNEVSTGNDDRLVVLFSHHGTGTLDNARGGHALGAADLLALIHRFGNVVLWLNGHTHTNTVRPHRSRSGRGGFWEVTTCAVVDWPCQTRVVEILDHGDFLSIVTTMVDHDTPAAPAALETTDDLAALHRELAANVPWDVSALAGAPGDRNAELRLIPPFPLGRLPLRSAREGPAWAPASCRPDERQRRVDRGDIARVAGDDGMPAVAGADGHAHVYYVRRPGGRAPGTHPKRHLGVQRDDRRVRRTQQAGDPGVTSAAAPRLGQDPGRDGQLRAATESFLHQHRHPRAARLERDQRPGVEGRAGHGSRPSTRRAHRRSSAVGWPLSA
jgi:metallophosphoesterase (TIGR03767 family)